MTTRDIDLKLETNTIISNSPVWFVFCKVDGHADDKEYFKYDHAAQPMKRNIDMDIRAKERLSTLEASQHPLLNPIMFLVQRITLQLANILIVSDLYYQIQ